MNDSVSNTTILFYEDKVVANEYQKVKVFWKNLLFSTLIKINKIHIIISKNPTKYSNVQYIFGSIKTIIHLSTWKHILLQGVLWTIDEKTSFTRLKNGIYFVCILFYFIL